MNTVFLKFIANLLPKILRLWQLRSLVNTELTNLMTKIPRVLEKRSTLSLKFIYVKRETCRYRKQFCIRFILWCILDLSSNPLF